jgi:hypothetical protein
MSHTVLQKPVVSGYAVIGVTISAPPPDQSIGRRSVLCEGGQTDAKQTQCGKTFHVVIGGYGVFGGWTISLQQAAFVK